MSEILIEFNDDTMHRTEDFEEFQYYCKKENYFYALDGKLYDGRTHELIGQWSTMD